MFNSERAVSKWVQLESPASYCLELLTADGTVGLLLVGCANGLVRAFSPLTLEYIATLPLPPSLSSATTITHHQTPPTGATTSSSSSLPMYPACYSFEKLGVWRKVYKSGGEFNEGLI
jgi:hypothetical protein